MEKKALDAERSDDWASVIVPRLEYWDVVIWQYRG